MKSKLPKTYMDEATIVKDKNNFRSSNNIILEYKILINC